MNAILYTLCMKSPSMELYILTLSTRPSLDCNTKNSIFYSLADSKGSQPNSSVHIHHSFKYEVQVTVWGIPFWESLSRNIILTSISHKRAIRAAKRSINIIWLQLANESGLIKEPNSRRETDWEHRWWDTSHPRLPLCSQELVNGIFSDLIKGAALG